MNYDDDPIEAFLDELLTHLRGSPRQVRRILTETEAHLRDAVDAGATPADAIARFGNARAIAVAANQHARVPLPVVARQAAVAGALLVAVGLCAIGASGLISAGMSAAFGPRFVAGDLPTVTYTAARCAEYHDLSPGAPTCSAAAARHHADEVVLYRTAAGVLGLAALGVWAGLRRRWRATPTTGALPASLTPTVGTAVFGVASVTLASEAMQSIGWRSVAGLGQWLSAAAVSAIVALAFALAAVRALRSAPLNLDA